ncbi:hypothetical protein ACFX15_038364 [Malus domestica]
MIYTTDNYVEFDVGGYEAGFEELQSNPYEIGLVFAPCTHYGVTMLRGYKSITNTRLIKSFLDNDGELATTVSQKLPSPKK